MIVKRRIVTWFEQDVHTGWRRLYCYTQRAGVCAQAKRQTNRRERRERHREIASQLGDSSWYGSRP